VNEKPEETILLLSNLYPSRDDPAFGVFVKRIEGSLEAAGYKVARVVIARQGGGMFRRLLRYLGFWTKATVRLLMIPGNSTVYAHYVSHCAIPILLTCRIKRHWLVIHVHGTEIRSAPETPAWLVTCKNWLCRRSFMLAKRVVVPSKVYSQLLKQKFGVLDEIIRIIPSGGVDREQFNSLGTPAEPPYRRLLYVGRLIAPKGILDAVRAFLRAAEQAPDLSLTIVGDGPLEGEVRKLCAASPLGNRVDLRSAESPDCLPAIYRSHDYLVFPSEWESLGLVGLEAMACGKPLIATAAGGMADYFLPGKNGLGVKIGDVDGMTRAMLEAMNMPLERYVAMAREALATAQRYDSKQAATSTAELFRRRAA
jgi:L-malate glycosyltransferase